VTVVPYVGNVVFMPARGFPRERRGGARELCGPYEGAVVIYDGRCGFCHAVLSALSERWRLPGQLVPWQAVDLGTFGISAGEAARQMWYIGPDRAASGALGFSAWLRGAGGLVGAVGLVLELPVLRLGSSLMYSIVARYRYQIPGPWGHTRPLPTVLHPMPRDRYNGRR